MAQTLTDANRHGTALGVMFALLCGAAYLHCWEVMLMVGVGCIAVMYDAWRGSRHFWHTLLWGTAGAVSLGSLALGLLATWP